MSGHPNYGSPCLSRAKNGCEQVQQDRLTSSARMSSDAALRGQEPLAILGFDDQNRLVGGLLTPTNSVAIAQELLRSLGTAAPMSAAAQVYVSRNRGRSNKWTFYLAIISQAERRAAPALGAAGRVAVQQRLDDQIGRAS